MFPEMPRYDTLLLQSPATHVLHIILNRPEVRNAMNTQMGKDLQDLICVRLRQPDHNVRVVVFSGAGDKAFGAGGDLKERQDMDDDTWRRQHEIFEAAIYGIMDLEVPTIAAVNGVAVGGGCELALACDFIHAAEQVRFGLPEITLGIFPGTGGTQHMARAMGTRRATELILSGTLFSAKAALEWGMVNAIHPAAELLPQVFQLASKIASHSPLAVRLARRSIYQGAQLDLHNALHLDLALYNHTVQSQDRREGITAFNEKRAPRFQGR